MTVIVKVEAPPLHETADQVIGDWLERLLGDLSFPQFEATKTGDLTILDTKFSMRVGKWLGRPTQAIMAQGQFVKLHTLIELKRSIESLKLLNPDYPDDCLYKGGWNPGLIDDEEEKRKQKEMMVLKMELARIELAKKQAEYQHQMEYEKMKRDKSTRSPVDGPWPRKIQGDGW